MSQLLNGNRIKALLETPENPISLEEFLEFWDSLTDNEKRYYRGIDLLG